MDRGLARVQQQEIAGPRGAVRLTRRQAALADERRLLIAERRGDGHAPERSLRMTIYFRRRPDFRKHGARHMKGVEQVLVPVQRVEADKLRAVGVGDVGQVTAGQIPDQPGIHGAGGDPAGLGGLPRARYAVEDQRDLGGGEIAGERQSRLLAERSEEHTSELQSLMRISYAVFCLKTKKKP